MRPSARSRARSRLLAWFGRHARLLPWRETRDPYAIWVSEVMLQQTRVETVLRYYDRFLARFPTLASLARADEDDVLTLWSGLGYYRRARLLHAGARAVLERHAGVVPREPEARRALPGVGRYTAGAIGSIAFGLPEPIVDGNVARVLSRLDAIDAPLGSRESESTLWSEARAWARHDAPGAVNQALMELGARICVPVTPKCDACPVNASCAARRAGRVAQLPVARAKRAPREVALVALVARDRDGNALLRKETRVRRAGETLGGELMKGLWSVPMGEGEGRGTARSLADAVGASLATARPTEVVHVLTHRKLRVAVFAARLERAPPGARLVSAEELDEIAVASLTRKILSAR